MPFGQLLLLALFIGSSSVQQVDGGTKRRQRNGYSAAVRRISIEECPYMASIQHKDVHVSTGVIISPSWVLATATSLDFIYIYYYHSAVVMAGVTYTYKFQLSQNRQISAIGHIFIHQNYDKVTLINDIGLVYLASKFDVTPSVQPVRVGTRPYNKDRDLSTMYDQCSTVYRTLIDPDDKANATMMLARLDLPIISLTRCRKLYEGIELTTKSVLPIHVCTMNVPHRPDLGEALLCNFDSKPMLQGLRTKTSATLEQDGQIMYTRLDKFEKWIQSTINSQERMSSAVRPSSSVIAAMSMLVFAFWHLLITN